MNSKFFMSVFVPYSILLPVIIGAVQFKKLTESAKVIWYYLLVSGIISFLAYFVGRVMHLNNLWLIHIYTALEVVLFCWFYKKILQVPPKANLFWIMPVAFVFLCIFNALFFQSIYTYSSYTRSVEAIICIIFALNYFARLATVDTHKKTVTMPEFYFNSGIFLYFSGAFMLFVFSNFIINASTHIYNVLWVIHAALVLCMYLFFSAGLFLCKR